MRGHTLLKEIEFFRKKMVTLASSVPLTDIEVVKTSVKLDKLLNEYNTLQQKNNQAIIAAPSISLKN